MSTLHLDMTLAIFVAILLLLLLFVLPNALQ
jgi:hypothetical protein